MPRNKKSTTATGTGTTPTTRSIQKLLKNSKTAPEENNNTKKEQQELPTPLDSNQATTSALTSTPTSTQRQTDGGSDEVIEEFDFSSNDLKALEDSDEATSFVEENVESGQVNAVDDVDANAATATDNKNKKPNKKQQIEPSPPKKNNNNNNVDENDSRTKKKTETEIKAAVEAEAEEGELLSFDNNNKEIATIAISAPSPPSNDISNSAQSTKTTQCPPNLVLSDDAPTEDTYCPITPRCIVDDNQSSDKDDVDESEDELLVQFLGEVYPIAEARLAARRQARAEAREIRMRELERQQKEQEQNADRVFDMQSGSGNASSIGDSHFANPARLVHGLLNVTRATTSRRSSEDSLEEEGRSLRDIRHELKDVEERFRKAMITNAQLDNDRASQTYEVKLLKDKIESMQEAFAQLQREFKEKTRECNAFKRNLDRSTLELKLVQGQLNERDALIAEQGLVIVVIENADGSDAKRALVSVENANILASVQGSLDVRLKKFNEEKQQLVAEVQKLHEQLESFKTEGKMGRGSSSNGPFSYDDDYEAQREANKIISDYKYKLQKAEQEVASLQASLARSETQVIRYKSTAEAAEKAEAELKVERRKLQRETLLVAHFWDECHCQ
ncbi:leucine-rich repeat flightless-interacting protein 2 isoform X2 [Scaptodrosophila lebanonensis]|uniref:Leucine-rich repeat flightless-interacting protein 2 isoform X2 n=1 Tax=Drosophila lebanonensis TaxID=7225 RepID=A0A6J2TR64_DROLE|nr:leucine-rich repeat flightless-interacting protein 2 isoform X2 [Scaptodrosophila lebanonensis]